MAQLQLPDIVFASILFFVDDCATRRALRASSARVQRAGDTARLVVRARCECPFATVYERMSWWSPWVGYLHVTEIRSSAAVAARFDELWVAATSQCDKGTFFDGRRFCCLHGCSDASILHSEFVSGRGWVCRYSIWSDATAST